MTKGKEIWAAGLFKAIDNKDTETLLTFLTDDVLFRFGNVERVYGKAAVGEVVSVFFDSVKELHHEVDRIWNAEDAVICHGTVTYTRHDSTKLSVPFANILVMGNNLIREYFVFVDTSELDGSA